MMRQSPNSMSRVYEFKESGKKLGVVTPELPRGTPDRTRSGGERVYYGLLAAGKPPPPKAHQNFDPQLLSALISLGSTLSYMAAMSAHGGGCRTRPSGGRINTPWRKQW